MTAPPHRSGASLPTTPSAAVNEADQGLRTLEGYLYWQAENRRARQAARDFTDVLPWLTTAQRDDVERHCTDLQLRSSREHLERLRQHHRVLHTEYETRYQRLRARCLASALTAVTVTLCVLYAISGLR